MNHPLLRFIISASIALTAIPFSAHAQDSAPNSAQINAIPAIPDAPTLDDVLAAPPTLRSKYARNFAKRPGALEQIDQWIADTSIDDPKNLTMKDILMAIPLKDGGPRLTELARKSADPAIQEQWSRWLANYPDARASVLQSWLSASNSDLHHYENLLNEYASIRPDSALLVWAQLTERMKPSELANIARFGLKKSGCAKTLSNRLLSLEIQNSGDNSDDDIVLLRLMRAISLCEDAPSLDADTRNQLIPFAAALLANSSPSRRIVAMLMAGAAQIQDKNIVDKLLSAFYDAKNSTERAIALRALEMLATPDQSARIMDALENGDETLRFEAAALLIAGAHDDLDNSKLKAVFDRELWPDTQIRLYQALAKNMTDADAAAFRRSLILDENRAQNLRLAVMNDIFVAAPDALTLDDLAELLRQNASLDLIAPAAEHIYAHSTDARPRLRQWILAQQPLDRRLSLTFARFMRVDSQNQDASAIDSMRAICKNFDEEENMLHPCLIYFEANAQNDDDKELLEKIRQKKTRLEAMMNYEF